MLEIHIILIGPAIVGASPVLAWQRFNIWRQEITSNWRQHCAEVQLLGDWSTSSTVEGDKYHLHFWFADVTDAIVFKLKYGHYMGSG